MSIKLAIIYYSSTGTNYQLSKWAKEGAEELGAEVRILKVPELAPQKAIDSNPAWKAHAEATKDVPEATLEDLEWADAYIFSTPTRYGSVAAQMRQFIDTTGGLWAKGKFTNKVVSAMTSAQLSHAGQEATILNLYTSMYHWGAIVVAPGFTDSSIYVAGGNPYGASVTIDKDGKMIEDVEAAVKYQAKRTVTVAEWVTKGNN
ncbi:MAG: NAD(P)H:quinone oxidoreductase type IV [Bacillota bacterium]|nr:NAD(P)H:quinone oxidoreductase type IV [Bacillota bacterium]